jgi:hypothetical protein
VIYLSKAWRLANGDLCRASMKYRAGHGEEMMSPLSVEYCRRARNHLVALGSPFAIAHPPASIADAPEKAPPKPALNSPGGVTLNLSQPLIPRVGGLGGGGLFRFRVALR